MIKYLAEKFGYVPVKALLDERNKVRETLAAKPQPKLKDNVQELLDVIKWHGFKHIGTIQDEFVFIYMLANHQEMYYLHVNFDGELMYLLKDINNKHIPALMDIVRNENANVNAALELTNNIKQDAQALIYLLTVANEQGQAIEYHTLTEREKTAVSVLKNITSFASQATVKLRGLK